MEKLHSKYSIPYNPPSQAHHYRDRLVKFYEKYNPEKVGTVDKTLEKFRGREEDLFQALRKKYNLSTEESNRIS